MAQSNLAVQAATAKIMQRRGVATDLEPIRAPAVIGPIDRDAAVMAPLDADAGVALEQQAMRLHHPVDALDGDRRPGGRFTLATQQSVDATVAVGRQLRDDRLNLGQQRRIRLGRRPIRAFSSADQRRRRCTDVINSTRSIFPVILTGILLVLIQGAHPVRSIRGLVHPALATGARRAVALHRTRQADAERVC